MRGGRGCGDVITKWGIGGTVHVDEKSDDEERKKIEHQKTMHQRFINYTRIQEKRTYDKENLKLNCQQAHPSAQLPSPSVNDNPNCISFNISTLHRNVCKSTNVAMWTKIHVNVRHWCEVVGRDSVLCIRVNQEFVTWYAISAAPKSPTGRATTPGNSVS